MTKKLPSFLSYVQARGLQEGEYVPAAKDPQKKEKTPKKQPQVKEYLDGSGKLVEKPVKQTIADYSGPNPTSPAGNPSPYRASEGKQASKGEAGLADKGAANLKYQPQTDTTKCKTVSSWPKTTTEEFLKKTKDMSIAEMAKYIVKECVCDSEKLILLRKTAEAIKETPNLMSYLVHEIKRTSGLDALSQALSEAVGPPIGLKPGFGGIPGDEEEEDEEGLEGLGDEEDPEGEEEPEGDDLGDDFGADDDLGGLGEEPPMKSHPFPKPFGKPQPPAFGGPEEDEEDEDGLDDLGGEEDDEDLDDEGDDEGFGDEEDKPSFLKKKPMPKFGRPPMGM